MDCNGIDRPRAVAPEVVANSNTIDRVKIGRENVRSQLTGLVRFTQGENGGKARPLHLVVRK